VTVLRSDAGSVVLCALVLLVLSGMDCHKNSPPLAPTISGPAVGRPGDTLVFTVNTTDPDDDIVSYLIAWGDTGSVAWSAEYLSGQNVTRLKVYQDTGTFLVQAKARDAQEAESEWSDTLPVRIERFPGGVPTTPPAPVGPTTTWQGAAVTYTVVTTAPGPVRYVMDWNDGTVDTSSAHESGETTELTHAWVAAATFDISVRAFLDVDPAKVSAASPTLAVLVNPNDAPVVDTLAGPPYTAVEVPTDFVVTAHDPDGDSLTVKVDWGDGTDTTSSLSSSPCALRFTHSWGEVETAYVTATAVDDNNATSAPETLWVRIGAAGAVMAYWWNSDEDQASLTTSAVLVSDGNEACIWGGCRDDYAFYGIRVSNMHTTATGSTRFPEYAFSGHAAYCIQTSHFIVGSEEGELYGLRMASLSKDWRYPGKTREESLTGIEWTAPAVNGNRIYVGHDSDSLFFFVDNGATVSRLNVYALRASLVDAPVIDVAGNVLVSTDSGYLCKFDANLNYVWRVHLQANGIIHAPVIGADGTIYCTSDSNRIFAVAPSDGQIRWTQALSARAMRPAVGADGIYVGCGNGRFYKLNPADGQPLWEKDFGSAEFATTPILAANGYAYAQNNADKLYCFKQSDGDTLWVCDCPSYLPHDRGARLTKIRRFAPNPTITAEGDIIVVGSDAVYKVKGYIDGPLDPVAPWPKWQKNHLNTGR